MKDEGSGVYSAKITFPLKGAWDIIAELQKEGLISEELIENLLTWKNSGFSVFSEGKVASNDDAGRERPAKYMIRSPISIKRLTYDRDNQIVYCRTDQNILTFEPVEYETRKKILEHLGLWNIRSHSPPPLPNIHPPLDMRPPAGVDNLARTVKLDGCFLAARRVEVRTTEITITSRISFPPTINT